MGISSNEQVTLLTDYDAASAYNTAYQALFNNIRFSWTEEHTPQHTVLLATPTTYTARTAAPVNVAIAAAQNGIPTILVDADLHTPSIQQRFGINDKPGLIELLEEKMPSTQQIAPYLHETFIPELSLLCAGHAAKTLSDSSRLLSMQLETLIQGLQQILREKYTTSSLIVFNAPPILSSIDATIISSHVEQTFLFIAAGHTTKSQARQAQQRLERAHAKVTGLIMLDA